MKQQTGKIKQIIGPVIDVEFENDIPELFTALEVIKNDKEYRQTVLDKLDSLHQRVDENDISLALLQRDNIERSYCMFVIEHGYCPSGMKQSINDMYQYYTDRGYNHIAKGRVEELMSLPEFPPN